MTHVVLTLLDTGLLLDTAPPLLDTALPLLDTAPPLLLPPLLDSSIDLS